jgi:hypothetical protein
MVESYKQSQLTNLYIKLRWKDESRRLRKYVRGNKGLKNAYESIKYRANREEMYTNQ